jgi:anti-anti-sigma regulatory factor
VEKERTRVVLVLGGRLDPAAMSGFCARVEALIDQCKADVVLCDVNTVYPDAVALDLLGKLRLAVLRTGCAFRLRDPSPELIDLLEFCGLGELAEPLQSSR